MMSLMLTVKAAVESNEEELPAKRDQKDQSVEDFETDLFEGLEPEDFDDDFDVSMQGTSVGVDVAESDDFDVWIESEP